VDGCGVTGGFDGFRARVQHDAALQEQLVGIEDHVAFVTAVVELGTRIGYRFTNDDVTSAMQIGRRSWLERGLP
jgi:hypothetical protein